MGDVPESSSLRLDTVTSRDRCVVVVHGDIDASTAAQLRAVVDAAADDARILELDLSDVGFMDSTGLGVIAAAIRRLQPTGGRVELTAVPPGVGRLLEITDLRRFVRIRSTRP